MRNWPASDDSLGAAVTTLRRYCIDCGYRLDNLPSHHCPECGRSFDLADQRTTSSGKKLGLFGRWAVSRHAAVIRPCRWLVPASFIVVAAIIFLSVFRGDLLPWLLRLCLAFVGLGIPFVSREIARGRLVKQHGLSREALKVDHTVIRRSRLIFIIGAVLIISDLPFFLILWPSLPALNRAAHYEWNIRPSNESRPAGLMIGLMPVKGITVGDGGINFKLPFGATLLYRETIVPDDPAIRHDSRWILGDWYIVQDESFELYPILH